MKEKLKVDSINHIFGSILLSFDNEIRSFESMAASALKQNFSI